MSAQLPDLIFGNLVSCHSLSLKLKHIRTQTLYLIGRTFRLFAETKYQLRKANLNDKSEYLLLTSVLSKWSPFIMEMIRGNFWKLP